MKGYYCPDGYYGLINGEYMLFATESDYWDYYISMKEDRD